LNFGIKTNLYYYEKETTNKKDFTQKSPFLP